MTAMSDLSERKNPGYLESEGCRLGYCTKEKTTTGYGNPVWFLARMKCPRDGEVLRRALKCSPYSTSPPSPFTLFRHRLLFSGGRSTSNLKQRGTSKKIHCPLRVRESLSSHDCDIYHGYALIRQESTLLSPHPGTGSTRRILLISPFRLPSILALGLPLSLRAFCLALASVLLPQEKFLQGMRLAMANKLLSRSSSSRDYSGVFNFFHLLALLFFSYFAPFFFSSTFISLKRSESSRFNTILFFLFFHFTAERNF